MALHFHTLFLEIIMRLIYHTLTLIVCCGCIARVHGQDPVFSQFYAIPTAMNPAYSGAYHLAEQLAPAPRITSAHRNEWPQFSGAYVTNTFAIDSRVLPLHGGIGLRILQDNAGRGTIGSREIAAAYSYVNKVTTKVRFRLALEAMYFEKSLNWNVLTFEDMVDPTLGFIYETQESPRGEVRRGLDFSAGGLVHSVRGAVGLAVHHLNEPPQSLLGNPNAAPLPRRWTFHFDRTFVIGPPGRSTSSISSKLRYIRQGEFQLFQLGAIWTETLRANSADKSLNTLVSWGLFYRGFPEKWRHDALMLTIGAETVSYRVSYSWDLTYSSLSPATGGAHELLITLFLPSEARQKQFCPVCDWKILNTRSWVSRRQQGRFN